MAILATLHFAGFRGGSGSIWMLRSVRSAPRSVVPISLFSFSSGFLYFYLFFFSLFFFSVSFLWVLNFSIQLHSLDYS